MTLQRTAALLAIGSLVYGSAAAQAPAPPRERGSLAELVAPPLTAEEEKLRGQIQARVAAEGRDVGRKTWRYLSPSDAAMLGLQRNLAIRLAGRQPLLAQEALREARAVFDPLLEVTLSQSATNKGSRSVTAEITRSTFVRTSCQSIPTAPGAATNGKPDVTQICFATRGGNTTLTDTVFAAPQDDAHPGTNKLSTASVGITQRLPWGPVLRLFETSTYNPTYYAVQGNSYTYDAPWASSLFAQLTLPLPGTKGFGPLAPANFPIEVARKVNERAAWDVRTAINGILLQVDLAYWDLVQAVQNLNVTIESRRLVEALVPSFERRYRLETLSRFDKAQTDAELARARVDEEIALRAYLSASTALAALVEDDAAKIADSVLFPAGFSMPGADAPRPKLEELQQASLAQRPELKARRIDSDINRLNVAFARNQARPDISLDVAVRGAQSSAVYGYKSLTDSLRALGSPDSESLSGALIFTEPLGHRAARAAVSSASASQAAGEIAEKAAANSVIRDANDAFSAHSSALRRLENAQDALKLSEFAYEQVQRRFEVGGFVSQVELNRNRRDLLAARLAVIGAQIDLRRAQSRLLGAQGTIADQYPRIHAYNDFERHRIAALAQSRALRYFLAGAQ